MEKKWHQYVGIRAALIVTVGAIVVEGMNIKHDRSKLKEKNNAYVKEIEGKSTLIVNLNQQLSQKASEIQRLETLLTPFRTIALEKYTGSEQEVLKKLADAIQELEVKASPRSLGDELGKTLQTVLSKVRPEFQVIVASRLMDAESQQYGDQLASVFERSGWRLGPRNPSFLDDVDGDVLIATTDGSQRICAENIKSALEFVGLRTRVENAQDRELPSIRKNTVYIIVGSKVRAKK